MTLDPPDLSQENDVTLTEAELAEIADPQLRQRVAALIQRCDRLQAEGQASQQHLEKLKLQVHLTQQMCQFKGGFLARVSHELRSPLSGLIGTHQLILNDLCEDQDEEREFLARAHEYSLKMVEMLDIVLKVARAEQGRSPLKVEPVRLYDVFEEARELSALQVANRNYHYDVRMPEKTLWVKADYKPLLQVLLHQIMTAIDGMSEGSLRLSSGQGSQNEVYIWLDSPCPLDIWNEPVEQLRSPPPEPTIPVSASELPHLSAGLSWLVDYTLLDIMGGQLEILQPPPDAEAGWLSRLQYRLQQVPPPPETESE
ncbi:HAMP domain-containing histidine kinase [Phormidium yuhuli AB48]|uniref:histidine kinase n=1 Tax=Phormidium yuhuli AB48 TaxID=2940671 RepID=A0ABY5AVB5_9CYAN|nr:HAMP domain-containing sensor histidine kinase [Phormidium yuhuli]USR92058.1 HAMP domain-containing histidine kinase [Phormidium yuhuli AB48]